MPGEILETNGDVIEGDTVTWNVTGNRRLVAVSRVSSKTFSDTNSVLLSIGGVLLIILIVLGAAWGVMHIMHKRNDSPIYPPPNYGPPDNL